MENPKQIEDTVLQIIRIFPVSPERAFRAWTEPEQLKKWFGPGGCRIPVAEMDVRVGGRYRITMQSRDWEENHTVNGEYKEVDSPHRLVFTWRWEHAPEDSPPTLVTVEFHPKGDGTEMVFTHDGFPAVDVRDLHGEGWTSSFNSLAEVLAG